MIQKKILGKISLNIVKKAAEIIILAAAIFFIGKFIWQGWPQVRDHIEFAKWNFVLFGCGLFFVYFLLRSWAWQLIMKVLGANLSLAKSSYIWFLSEFSRYIPGNVWSFLGRVYLSDKEKVPKRITSVSLILEVFYLLGSSLCIGLIILMTKGTEFQISWWLITIGAVALILLLNPKIFIAILNKLLAKLKKQPIMSKINFWHSIWLFLLYIVVWTAYGLASYYIAAAFVDLRHISVLWLISTFVLSWAIGYVSFITPMGLGVREAVIVTFLKTAISTPLASLVALVTRIFLIFSELTMLAAVLIKKKLSEKKDLSSKIIEYIKAHKHTIILWTMILLYAAYFISYTFLRHGNFLSSRYDLGNMDQTVWNTAHGHFFQLTSPETGAQVSRFSIHSDLFLALIAPLYWIYGSPYTLLFLQGALVALGALPVYWLAKAVLKNKSLALVLAFSYLMYPGTQWANIFDFHAVLLATPLLLFAFYYLYEKKYIPFIIFGLLAMSTKETVAFSIAMIAIYIILVQKNWKFGAAVGTAALAWFGLLLSRVMPNARGNVDAHFALSYYKYFGNDTKTILKTLLLKPMRAIDYIRDNNRWYYFTLIFAPVGYLGFLTPLVILAIPPIALNILSDQWQMSSINYQYTGDITPFIFIASIFGLAWLIKFIKRRIEASGKKINLKTLEKIAIGYVLVMTLYCSWKWSPLPFAKTAETKAWTYRQASKKYLDELSKSIPKNQSVSATNRMAPHFTNRKVSYLFPNGIGQADYIVVEQNYPLELRTSQEVQDNIKKIEQDNRYVRIFKKDDIEVFKKKGVN